MDENERQLKVQMARLEKMPTLEWQAFEYNYNEKNSDWFWMVGIVGGVAMILAILFKNFLFGIVILLSTFTVLMYGARKPELVTFAITAKGIRIKNNLYSFKSLLGFAIKEDDNFAKLMIHSDRIFLPHIILPLDGVDPELFRERLSLFLDEEHFEETLVDIFVERLGF